MTYNAYYEFTISQIDKRNEKISDFDDETFFMNIYHFWCFTKYLSPYYSWNSKALERLKRNIKREWCKDFSNVNLFIELVENGRKQVNPFNYLHNSEDYFEILRRVKFSMDLLIKEKHLQKEEEKEKKVDFKRRKCIR